MGGPAWSSIMRTLMSLFSDGRSSMVLHYEDTNVLIFRWEVQHGPPLRGHQCPYFQMGGLAWSSITRTLMSLFSNGGPAWSSITRTLMSLFSDGRSSMVFHYEDINVLIFKWRSSMVLHYEGTNVLIFR